MPQPDDSNNKQVVVGFDTTTHAFTFSQDPVTFDRPGKIILVKDQPSNQGWNLSSVLFDGDGSQFPVKSRSGQQIVIDDDYTQLGTFSYRVVVTDSNNVSYTSQDPKIVNENPT